MLQIQLKVKMLNKSRDARELRHWRASQTLNNVWIRSNAAAHCLAAAAHKYKFKYQCSRLIPAFCDNIQNTKWKTNTLNIWHLKIKLSTSTTRFWKRPPKLPANCQQSIYLIDTGYQISLMTQSHFSMHLLFLESKLSYSNTWVTSQQWTFIQLTCWSSM